MPTASLSIAIVDVFVCVDSAFKCLGRGDLLRTVISPDSLLCAIITPIQQSVFKSS